jgi:hypothetical protein
MRLYLFCLFIVTFLSSENQHDIPKNKQASPKKPLNSFQLIASDTTNDGPYLFITDSNIIEKVIIDGSVITTKQPLNSRFTTFKADTSFFNTTEPIAAMSDFHGQFKLATTILHKNGVIDSNNHWSFGKGHFVITGDIFDRGPKVTDLLWFIFNLEKEAELAGGKVHYLLGNHEFMVLHKDLRYLNEKYIQTEKSLDMSYDQIFNNQSVLGRWLRSKSTVVQINDFIFLHGGLSKKFVDLKYTLDETNDFFRNTIDLPNKAKKSVDSLYNFYGKNGPIWYRGYFLDSLDVSHIDSLLAQLNVANIIVGHTSFDALEKRYSGKIVGIDSRIKYGLNGELLLIENGVFFRCKKTGEKTRL